VLNLCVDLSIADNDTYDAFFRDGREAKMAGKDVIVSSTEAIQVYQILPAGSTDDMVIGMWLDRSKSPNTKAAYKRDVNEFLLFIHNKPLRSINLLDLQAFDSSLASRKQSSRVRTINAIKSLFTFCTRTGYTPINVGTMVKPGEVPSKLAGRILTEEQVFTMFALEDDQQKRVILRLLYYAGLRVSELCSLTWVDVQPNGEAGQVTVVGKGDKVRSVLITTELYQELLSIREGAPIDAPVFPTRTGSAIDRTRVFRIVAEAAEKARIPLKVSPHWLRHAHASHALNHNAPAQLVRDTLGHSSLLVTDKYSHARPSASSANFLPI